MAAAPELHSGSWKDVPSSPQLDSPNAIIHHGHASGGGTQAVLGSPPGTVAPVMIEGMELTSVAALYVGQAGGEEEEAPSLTAAKPPPLEVPEGSPHMTITTIEEERSMEGPQVGEAGAEPTSQYEDSVAEMGQPIEYTNADGSVGYYYPDGSGGYYYIGDDGNYYPANFNSGR